MKTNCNSRADATLLDYFPSQVVHILQIILEVPDNRRTTTRAEPPPDIAKSKEPSILVGES